MLQSQEMLRAGVQDVKKTRAHAPEIKNRYSIAKTLVIL